MPKAIGIDLIHIQDGAMGSLILCKSCPTDLKMDNQNWFRRHQLQYVALEDVGMSFESHLCVDV